MKEPIFRYSMKAIIIQDNKLLVESCDYGRGRFCKLPGGVISGGYILLRWKRLGIAYICGVLKCK